MRANDARVRIVTGRVNTANDVLGPVAIARRALFLSDDVMKNDSSDILVELLMFGFMPNYLQTTE